MNPALVTAGPEFGLDLGRAISAVGEHIIAGVARVQQPIQLLAVVQGRIGHRIMPDQLVLGVRVHMVLVAEEAAAMLLGPARIAVLLPHFGGLLLPPRWCAPRSPTAVRGDRRLRSRIRSAADAPRRAGRQCAQPAAWRSRHDCSAASAPARYWRR